jgi:hypothetical protein
MTMIKSLLLAAGSASLLFLGACSGGGNQASAPVASPAASSPVTSSPTTSASPAASAHAEAEHKSGGEMAHHDAEHKSGSGLVVESGAYHLELVPEKEGSETHLDLFVQKGDSHETVANAKVTAQVQLPDGSQKSVEMAYEPEAKHYTAKVASVATGEYKVVIQSEIGGEKVNARYAFKQ